MAEQKQADERIEQDRLRDDLAATLVATKQHMWLEARSSWTMADFKNWAIVQKIDGVLERYDGRPRTEAAIAKAQGRVAGAEG